MHRSVLTFLACVGMTLIFLTLRGVVTFLALEAKSVRDSFSLLISCGIRVNQICSAIMDDCTHVWTSPLRRGAGLVDSGL